jgi:hypothetical protein
LCDDYYDIPFGCFVPRAGEGLLVAGRCLSNINLRNPGSG